jgi:NitT/TauT family transport system ATP-binding protein
MSAGGGPVVAISALGKTFDTAGSQTVALTGIDLTIAPGEFISLIGPSGCGKSTLLRLIGDLTRPTSGTLEVNGKPATRARTDRDYGMVFQAPVLFDWRTIEGNVGLPLEIIDMPKARRTRRIADMLALVELSDFARHHPWQLSGGMQQRAAIARALVHDPKLVLMDEPFGALDALTREKMNIELLRIWSESGKTIVFVTHSIQEAIFLSTHCAVLTAGPARMADYFKVELPYPRKLDVKSTEAFGAYARRLYHCLGME